MCLPKSLKDVMSVLQATVYSRLTHESILKIHHHAGEAIEFLTTTVQGQEVYGCRDSQSVYREREREDIRVRV